MTITLTARHALIDGALVDGVSVHIGADGMIHGIGAATDPFDAHVLAPGFVDLQVNGIDDVDVATARGDDWDRLDQVLLAQGTTTWCPTLVTAPLDRYAERIRAIDAAARRPGCAPAIAGVHLEGPFLGRALGAHRPEFVRDVDLDWIAGLPSVVRVMTLGAEQHLAVAAIGAMGQRGVACSIGHTMASDDECDAAAEAGARLVTHLFNAMTGLRHRQPGVAAWALAHPSIACSIIADGVHVAPRMLHLAARLLGPQRLVLVTDAVAWRAGRAGEVRLRVVDGAPRLADGTLAGSVLTMDQAVRTCVAAGIDLATALTAASTTPSHVLGLRDRGVIEAGRRADLVALSPTLRVDGVWVRGERLG